MNDIFKNISNKCMSNVKITKIKNYFLHNIWVRLSGFIIVMTFIVILFPNISKLFERKIINSTNIGKPEIIFQDLSLDHMYNEKDIFKIVPGYYLDYDNMRMQRLIKFDSQHDVVFTLKNKNGLIQDPVVIKKVYLKVNKFIEKEFDPVFIVFEYGAGETEKIYKIDPKELSEKLSKGGDFRIEAQIDKENIEKFNFVSLSGEKMEDYFKVKIPLEKHGIINFNIEIEGSYRGGNIKVSTNDFWIGNSKVNEEKFYQNEIEGQL